VPLPIIADTYLANFKMVQGSSTIENVICVRSSVTVSTSDVMDHVQGAWFLSNSIADQQTDSAVYEQLSITPLDGSGLATVVDLTGETGGISGEAVTVAVCLVTTLRTAERGRSRRGRLYLSSGPIANLTDTGTRWDSSATNNMDTAMGHFTTDLESHNLTLEVLSRLHGDSLPVQSWRANSYLGTQRRRAQREQRP
jgi:hypothetical protein